MSPNLPAITTTFLLALLLAGEAAAGNPAEDFEKPPGKSQPQVWFHWINGHIGKEGLTKDLESMRAAGISGGMVFDLLQPGPPGPVAFFTPEWRALNKHLFAEAARLGLEFGVHNCPGYSSSGGPWVAVEESMKVIGWTETLFDGPGRPTAPLPSIAEKLGFYRDVAVLAYPEAPGGGNALVRHRKTVQIWAGTKQFPAASLADQDAETSVPLENAQPVNLVFPADVTVASVAVGLRGVGREGGNLTVLAKDASGNFTPIAELAFNPFLNAVKTANVQQPIHAKEFRVDMGGGFEKQPPTLSGIGLYTSAMLADPSVKAQFASGIQSAEATVVPEGVAKIPAASELVNLTDKLLPDGTLDWEAPSGTWTILRFGMTTSGKRPHPARVQGLECDKLDAAAMRKHLKNYVGVLVEDAGENAGKSFRSALIDSYEVGLQNWTARMPEIFRQRAGYDLGPWMATLTGRLVASVDESERFLWDFRRTLADQFADAYYGTFREFLHGHGMLAYAEAYEGHGKFIGDTSQCSSRVDVPMCEFWWREPAEGKPPGGAVLDYVAGAHAANTTGKQVVAAEAFSALPPEAGWRNHPATMKAQADQMFLSGVNQIKFHAHPHQPYDTAPGITLGVWGNQFGRLNSWWPLSRGWHDYLARCQRLLQEGTTRSDVARLIDTEVPERYGAELPPPRLPSGFRWDNIGAEVVTQKLQVREGKLVLAHGAEYQLLLLEETSLPIELARKLADLVRAGATLYGPRPERTTGLLNQKANEGELARIAEELWGPIDGTAVTEHRAGKGRVVWGKPLAEVLADTPPDFDAAGAPLGFLHRRAPGFDAYFVVNRSNDPVRARGQFRVSGRPAELWEPVTGKIRSVVSSPTPEGRTAIDLDLPPQGSVFVVFREGGAKPEAAPHGKREILATLNGPWTVTFQPGRGAPSQPVSFETLTLWNQNEDPRIRHFSGVATYRTTLTLLATPKNARLMLDAGVVADVARVRVNGALVGDLWHPSIRLDVTSQLRAGENIVEIEVANRWVNRLIGDEQFPEDLTWKRETAHGATGSALATLPEWFPDLSKRPEPRRIGFPFFKHYSKESPLVPSGLVGPVRLIQL